MIKSLNDIDAIRFYLKRIGAEARSLRTAVVKEQKGKYWEDIAIIHFSTDSGQVSVDSKQYAPTPDEAEAIKTAILGASFPRFQIQENVREYPKEFSSADPKNIFEFRDCSGRLIMLQLRIDRKAGEKAYVPYTYWSDNEWRKAEPEGELPLYNLDKIKNNTTVFIHEGAKAAKYVQWMIECETPAARAAYARCPWADELSNAVHLGWIGGALSPNRTDWKILRELGIKRVYIVSDNDQPGVSAVPKIARNISIPTYHVQFTNEWPASFDLADEWPEDMFRELEGKRHYVGPAFRSCLHPATWATDLIPNRQGKPTAVLRESFKGQWIYVEEADIYVCPEMPELIRAEPILNKSLAAFSDAAETSRLINKSYQGKFISLCYRPDNPMRYVINQDKTALNLYIVPSIKSSAGNAKPWLDFVSYLIPDETECKELLRWCATLIARPETRMEYGVLLASETQGMGKTTLGVRILASLVGMANASFPSETAIVESPFNDWAAQKRLVVIDEIYAGQSWKAYNKLKKYITDRLIEVNKKYMRPYTLENWCHIFASSNSKTALKIENEDRRWFYPTVAERQWPKEKFIKFHNWLESGGLEIIKHWAETYGDYVISGERAPMTKAKIELIADSQSEASQRVSDIAMCLLKSEAPLAVAMKEVMMFLKREITGPLYESELKLRRIMQKAGVNDLGTMWVGGKMQHVMANELAGGLEDARKVIQRPEQLVGGEVL